MIKISSLHTGDKFPLHIFLIAMLFLSHKTTNNRRLIALTPSVHVPGPPHLILHHPGMVYNLGYTCLQTSIGASTPEACPNPSRHCLEVHMYLVWKNISLGRKITLTSV